MRKPIPLAPHVLAPLVELAREARVWNESDWGSERHTTAFNAFFQACEAAVPDRFGPQSDFDRRTEKATSDEIVDAALERLGIRREDWPWRINDAVELPEGYEAYPNYLIREPLRGWVVDLASRGYVFVRITPPRPELAEWNGLLHVVEDESGATPGMVRQAPSHGR